MKILFVTGEGEADFRYGLGKSITPIMDYLQEQGHDITYFNATSIDKIKPDNFLQLRQFILQKLLALRQEALALVWDIIAQRLVIGYFSAKIALKKAIDCVHFHDPLLVTGYKLYEFFNFTSTKHKLILTNHAYGRYLQSRPGVPIPKLLATVLIHLEQYVIANIHQLVCPSQSGLKQLAKELNITKIPKNWHAIYHPRPNINIYNRDHARQLLNFDKNTSYIISVGQLIAMKGFDLLLAAISNLLQYNCKVIILGDGNTKKLLDIAQQLKISDRILFTTTNDIGLYLSAADIYVSSSTTESFGMANLEAVIAGLPVICTNVGAVPEIVGDAAMLVESNVADITKAIKFFLDYPTEAKAYATKAQQHGKKWPNTNQIAQLYLNLYSGCSSEQIDNNQYVIM